MGASGPFIVTTKRPLISVSPFASRGSFERDALPVVSRRAVATLEEARVEAHGAILSAYGARRLGEDGNALMVGAARLSESGGSVGPLPDGTVIEVSQATPEALFSSLSHLVRASLSMQDRDTNLEAILAAFNARETQHGQ